MTDKEIKILAVDAGFDRLGLAILNKINNKDNLLYSDCIQTDKKNKIEDRIFFISNNIEEIIKKHKPNTLICESLFVFKNHKTVIDVAGIRGVLLYLAAKYGLSFYEFTPIQIKSCITGDGRADKKQIDFMIRNTFKDYVFKEKILDDEMDAIAIGITGLAYIKNICYI